MLRNGNKILDSNGSWVNVKPFNTGATAAVVTDTTAVTLKAAVTGKRHWITGYKVVNITAGQYPVAELVSDPGGTPVVIAYAIPKDSGHTASFGGESLVFDPPIEVAVTKAIGHRLKGATGDCYGTIEGYVES